MQLKEAAEGALRRIWGNGQIVDHLTYVDRASWEVFTHRGDVYVDLEMVAFDEYGRVKAAGHGTAEILPVRTPREFAGIIHACLSLKEYVYESFRADLGIFDPREAFQCHGADE